LESYIDHKTDRQPAPTPNLEIMGSPEAISDLFEAKRQRLLYKALRVLGNSEDAEDALQEGLLAAFCNLHRFEGRACFSTWLTRIVINAALMRRRKLGSHRTHESESIEEPIPGQGGACLSDRLVDTQPNPEEALLRTEQHRILKQGLKSLTEPYRRVLSLQVFQGMTSREAALVLGLPDGTVKSQVHRGRQKLLQQLSKLQGHSPVGECRWA
jgi:RNA polymerase sigma-70 factor (ECF subfamily)